MNDIIEDWNAGRYASLRSLVEPFVAYYEAFLGREPSDIIAVHHLGGRTHVLTAGDAQALISAVRFMDMEPPPDDDDTEPLPFA